MDRIGININSSKDEDGKILECIKKIIMENKPSADFVIFYDSINLDSEKASNLDVVIALGGDGTILRTARALKNFSVPILGVNIGNLGFLAAVEFSKLDEAVKALINGEYDVEERMMIKCTIEGSSETKSYFALNDVVISKGTLSRIVKYKINVDNDYYTSFNADGVIISTPTGSTAYALSAGGPIIYPTLNLIEITPICPHSPGMRTIVLDSRNNVRITIEKGKESVFLTVDGQEAFQLEDEDKVLIHSSDLKCKVIRLKDYNYFDVLRTKIIWRTKDCEGD